MHRTTLPTGAVVHAADHMDVLNCLDEEFPITTLHLARVRALARRGEFRCVEPGLCLTDTSATATQPYEAQGTGGQHWGGLSLDLKERYVTASPIPVPLPRYSGFFGSVQAEFVVPNVELPPFSPETLRAGAAPGLWYDLIGSGGPRGVFRKDTGGPWSNMKSAYWVGLDNGATGTAWDQVLSEVGLPSLSTLQAGKLAPGATNEAVITLWQAGVQCNLTMSSSTAVDVNCYPWFQVLGPHGTGSQYHLSNLIVERGDLIEVQLTKLPKPGGSALSSDFNGAAYCVITNWTRGTYVEFAFYCRALLLGAQAEWIVERTGNPSAAAWLPNFGSILFDSAQCSFNPGSGADIAFSGGPGSTVFRNVYSTTIHAGQQPVPALVKQIKQEDVFNNKLTDVSVIAQGLLRCDYVFRAESLQQLLELV
jgi:peptidase A4-like protein